MIRALILSLLATTAHAADKERVYQKRFCAGMKLEARMDNGTRADCVSGRLAIEVDWQDKWNQALGQAMSYSASTGHHPAVILICRKKPRRCEKQYERLAQAANFWKVPLIVWQCKTTDARLADCTRTELPNITIQDSKSRRKAIRRAP